MGGPLIFLVRKDILSKLYKEKAPWTGRDKGAEFYGFSTDNTVRTPSWTENFTSSPPKAMP